ncbi:MAG TPA: FAD-dependent oxidoreductase [Polyangiaceae bacterium]|nr:FAD-dependent oxidoreductase [Polyangiaceae bacterium]
MRNRVIVIGGGVAGLTAAHELVRCGFDVHVYERRPFLGGKAASSTSKQGFPSEHGFRFFPGWYRHLPDTLERIPYRTKTVAQNLVRANESLFAHTEQDPIPALLRFPRNLRDLATLAGFPEHLFRVGLTAADLTFFFQQLALFAARPEAERIRLFEGVSWWDFMQADARSEPFRHYLVDGITRNTVAANPRLASAYTIATVALRTLLDTARPDMAVDRVLNGPTNEVWIDPWVAHLKAQGVEFHLDAELESIEVEGRDISGVRFLQYGVKCRKRAARLQALKCRERWLQTRTPEAKAAWLAAGVELESLGEPAPGEDEYLPGGSQCAERSLSEALDEAQRESAVVRGDYYVLALPVEQMAYYVQRSEMLQRKAPGLKNVLALSNHVEWMSGIQFYLTEDLKITPGHIDCLDSEWALTAISQSQFWSEVDLKDRGAGEYRGQVKAILSVDISAWNVVGCKLRKEAFACEPQEIAEEVWEQLRRALNRRGKAPLLRNEFLLGYHANQGDRVPECAYHLDDDLVGRFDRKKQAFYKRYESVRFSAEAVAERASSRDQEGALPTLFAHGQRLHMNVEPLLVNRPGTLGVRPSAKTEMRNLFLAADYVATNTNLATMEGANEAARRAVNEILAVSGSQHAPCRLWTFALATDLVASLVRFAQGAGLAQGSLAVQAASSLAASWTNAASRAISAFVSKTPGRDD